MKTRSIRFRDDVDEALKEAVKADGGRSINSFVNKAVMEKAQRDNDLKKIVTEHKK